MQRMFVKQIQHEQALERERQSSTARSLGSISGYVLVEKTNPYLAQNPLKTRDDVSIEKLGSKRRAASMQRPSVVSLEDYQKKPKKSRTFSNFDFDEIYFSVFEPEKKAQDTSRHCGDIELCTTPVAIVPNEEDSDDDVEDMKIFETIFRQEDHTIIKEKTHVSPEHRSSQNLVSIVTDDDDTDDDHYESEPEKWEPSDLDPFDWEPTEKNKDTDSSASAREVAIDPTEISIRLLHAMDASSKSLKELLNCNCNKDVEEGQDEDDVDEMSLQENFTKAISKSAESRKKLRASLEEQPCCSSIA